ncbi:hypothetical protein HDV00_011864 [Rhizophlyctis rosea]|nr:hypothetical protein HDV00_011864 [Rhizophlyctis rosea]
MSSSTEQASGTPDLPPLIVAEKMTGTSDAAPSAAPITASPGEAISSIDKECKSEPTATEEALNTPPYPTDLLRQATIHAVLRSREEQGGRPTGELVDLWEGVTIEEALDTLAKHHISAVPVYKKSEDGTQKTHYAVVGVEELLDYAVFQHIFDKTDFTCCTPEDPNTQLSESEKEKCIASMRGKEDYFKHTLQTLLATSAPSEAFTTYTPTTPLINVVTLFSSGIQRAFVAGKGGAEGTDVESVITQGDLVRFLWEQCGEMGGVYEKGVEGVDEGALEKVIEEQDVGKLPEPVGDHHVKYALKLPTTTPLLTLYRTLTHYHTRSIALYDPTDPSHHITTTVSLTDFLSTRPETLADLVRLTGGELVTKQEEKKGLRAKAKALVVKAGEKVGNVMRRFVEGGKNVAKEEEERDEGPTGIGTRGVWIVSTTTITDDDNNTVEEEHLIRKITYTELLSYCIPTHDDSSTASIKSVPAEKPSMATRAEAMMKEGETRAMEGFTKLVEGASKLSVQASEGLGRMMEGVFGAVTGKKSGGEAGVGQREEEGVKPEEGMIEDDVVPQPAEPREAEKMWL